MNFEHNKPLFVYSYDPPSPDVISEYDPPYPFGITATPILNDLFHFPSIELDDNVSVHSQYSSLCNFTNDDLVINNNLPTSSQPLVQDSESEKDIKLSDCNMDQNTVQLESVDVISCKEISQDYELLPNNDIATENDSSTSLQGFAECEEIKNVINTSSVQLISLASSSCRKEIHQNESILNNNLINSQDFEKRNTINSTDYNMSENNVQVISLDISSCGEESQENKLKNIVCNDDVIKKINGNDEITRNEDSRRSPCFEDSMNSSEISSCISSDTANDADYTKVISAVENNEISFLQLSPDENEIFQRSTSKSSTESPNVFTSNDIQRMESKEDTCSSTLTSCDASETIYPSDITEEARYFSPESTSQSLTSLLSDTITINVPCDSSSLGSESNIFDFSDCKTSTKGNESSSNSKGGNKIMQQNGVSMSFDYDDDSALFPSPPLMSPSLTDSCTITPFPTDFPTPYSTNPTSSPLPSDFLNPPSESSSSSPSTVTSSTMFCVSRKLENLSTNALDNDLASNKEIGYMDANQNNENEIAFTNGMQNVSFSSLKNNSVSDICTNNVENMVSEVGNKKSSDKVSKQDHMEINNDSAYKCPKIETTHVSELKKKYMDNIFEASSTDTPSKNVPKPSYIPTNKSLQEENMKKEKIKDIFSEKQHREFVNKSSKEKCPTNGFPPPPPPNVKCPQNEFSQLPPPEIKNPTNKLPPTPPPKEKSPMDEFPPPPPPEIKSPPPPPPRTDSSQKHLPPPLPPPPCDETDEIEEPLPPVPSLPYYFINRVPTPPSPPVRQYLLIPLTPGRSSPILLTPPPPSTPVRSSSYRKSPPPPPPIPPKPRLIKQEIHIMNDSKCSSNSFSRCYEYSSVQNNRYLPLVRELTPVPEEVTSPTRRSPPPFVSPLRDENPEFSLNKISDMCEDTVNMNADTKLQKTTDTLSTSSGSIFVGKNSRTSPSPPPPPLPPKPSGLKPLISIKTPPPPPPTRTESLPGTPNTGKPGTRQNPCRVRDRSPPNDRKFTSPSDTEQESRASPNAEPSCGSSKAPPPAPAAPLSKNKTSCTSVSPYGKLVINRSDLPLSSPEEEIQKVFTTVRNWGWVDESVDTLAIYTQFRPIIQQGPICGLVALSMASQACPSSISAESLLTKAKERGISNHGEMFSTMDMSNLTNEALTGVKASVRKDVLPSSLAVIRILLQGDYILFPYDAEPNHFPGFKRGHKAHWGLLCGCLIQNKALIFKPEASPFKPDSKVDHLWHLRPVAQSLNKERSTSVPPLRSLADANKRVTRSVSPCQALKEDKSNVEALTVNKLGYRGQISESDFNVICLYRQGKSRNLIYSPLKDICRSNAQIEEYPTTEDYVIKSVEEGLAKQVVILHKEIQGLSDLLGTLQEEEKI